MERQEKKWCLGFEKFWLFLVTVVVCNLCLSVSAFRPLRDQDAVFPWGEQAKSEAGFETDTGWNVSGTYRGTWNFQDTKNGSSRFPGFRNSNGQLVFEIASIPTKIHGVHYVQGLVIFRDGSYSDEHNPQTVNVRMEGVYIWPFRQVRMVANSGADEEHNEEEDFIPSNPYHLLGIFSSQVLQESPRENFRKKGKSAFVINMEKHCNLQIAAQISQVPFNSKANGISEQYHMEGVVESPLTEDNGECFLPIALNATSINVEVYYNKAVNYTLMVTFVSFIQVLLLIRQMEHSNTQSGAAKVSLLMIGEQAIMDAYLCLLHLTAGILVESLFNAFATAAFFKFVVFSIFEMRYLLAIWKARRPLNSGEGWEIMRRELSALYTRFYGVLIGGIVIMYEFHTYLRLILFLLYSFWIPQIITNVVRDTRKPLHPHYIIGVTFTRLAIPLYVFGCPKNFMRVAVDMNWCTSLVIFLFLQAAVLLLQHYFGARWFIPRQILPEKYSYFRRVDLDSSHLVDCVICMAAVDTIQRSSECMVTPCDHYFHAGCLQRWMDIKMECPTCRRPLPPV